MFSGLVLAFANCFYVFRSSAIASFNICMFNSFLLSSVLWIRVGFFNFLYVCGSVLAPANFVMFSILVLASAKKFYVFSSLVLYVPSISRAKI